MRFLLLIGLIFSSPLTCVEAAELGDIRVESVWVHSSGGKLVQVVEYLPSQLVGEAWNSFDGVAGLYWMPPQSNKLYELWTRFSGASTLMGGYHRKYELTIASNTKSGKEGATVEFEIWNAKTEEREYSVEEALDRGRKLYNPEGFGWRNVTKGTARVQHEGQNADFILDTSASAQMDKMIQTNKSILVSLPKVQELKYIFGSFENNMFLSIDGSLYRGGMDTYRYLITDNSGMSIDQYAGNKIADGRDQIVELESKAQFFWPNSNDVDKQAYIIFPGNVKTKLDRIPDSQWTESFLQYLELPVADYKQVDLRSPCEIFYNP